MSLPVDWDPYLRLLTIDEAAESVRRPSSTIRRWLTEGRIAPVARMGRQPLLRESEVLATDARLRRPVTPTRDNGKPPRER